MVPVDILVAKDKNDLKRKLVVFESEKKRGGKKNMEKKRESKPEGKREKEWGKE